MGSIEEVVRAGDGMSAMPATVVRLTAAIAQGNTDPNEIVSLIKNDEVLTGAVLRRANSVSFGAQGTTFGLHQSIVRLGTKNLSHIIMEQKASDMFASAGSAYGLSRGALWRSGIGGAIGAEFIAKRISPELCELAYVAGLMRDIGKIAIEAFYGERYFSALEPHAHASRTFVECERLALGFDHAEVGGAMAKAWGLPEELSEAIRWHHEPPAPDEEGHRVLNDIVHAADAVCLWAGLAVGHDGLAYTIAPHVRESLRLSRRETEIEIAHVWTEAKAVEENLNAPTAQEKSA